MLVQYHVPQFLTGRQLDRFLAGGWFRNGHMMFRSQFLCIEKDLFTVVNIRLPLDEYKFPKRLRKTFNRNQSRFTFTTGHCQIDAEKELLFRNHRHRFKGFLFDSLSDFFAEDLTGHHIFDTKEVCVYDGDQLIAFSFFDEGENSVASLLGVFDDAYRKYSLGTYTMLLEIMLAQQKGISYYYPGYVLDKPSIFDYKLRLGTMEYYSWLMARWENSYEEAIPKNQADTLTQIMSEAQQQLTAQNIAHQKILYPVFSLGYLPGFEDFLRAPVFLTLKGYQQNLHCFYLVYYSLEDKKYFLIQVEKNQELHQMTEMKSTMEMLDKETYCIVPLMLQKIIQKSDNFGSLIPKILKLSNIS